MGYCITYEDFFGQSHQLNPQGEKFGFRTSKMLTSFWPHVMYYLCYLKRFSPELNTFSLDLIHFAKKGKSKNFTNKYNFSNIKYILTRFEPLYGHTGQN